MRGRFGPCATRQIFVRGQFAPGKDAPGHRAQSPKLRTLVTSSRDIGSRKSEASSSCRVKHNHFEPVEKMRGQSSTMITSDRLSSLTFWLISNPSPGLSSLLSEPLLSHLLVDLQPFSGNLLSDDIRTIPSSSQTRDVCDQSSTIITSDFVVLSSNSSGRVLVT